MFNQTDCPCTNDLVLSSNCLAQQAQDEAIGNYQQICKQSDLTHVYIHIDPAINMYLYYQTAIQVK